MQNSTNTGTVKSLLSASLTCLFSFLGAWLAEAGYTVLLFPLLCVAGGIFSYFLAVTKKSALSAIPVIVSVTVLQIFGGYFASIFGGVTFLSSLLVTARVVKKAEKTSVMTTLSVALGAGAVLAASVVYAMKGGSFALSDLMEQYNGLFSSLQEKAIAFVHQMVENLSAFQLDAFSRAEISKEMLTEAYVGMAKQAVSTVQLLMPGLLIFALQCLSYLFLLVFRGSAKISGTDEILPTKHWHLFPEKISCIIYVSLVVINIFSMIFVKTMNPFMIVLLNLVLSLMPVMLFCGFRVMVLRLATPGFRARTIVFLILFIVGMFLLPPVALQMGTLFLSYYGAQTVLTRYALDAKINQQ